MYGGNHMPGQQAGTIENGHFRSFNQIQANHLMPSYIQILFAPRRPIPYVEPIKKPAKINYSRYFNGKTNYMGLKEKLNLMRAERLLKEPTDLDFLRKKEDYEKSKGVLPIDRKTRWKEKMIEHLKVKQVKYLEWKKSLKNPDFENVTTDPFKTLIVYQLVKF